MEREVTRTAAPPAPINTVAPYNVIVGTMWPSGGSVNQNHTLPIKQDVMITKKYFLTHRPPLIKMRPIKYTI